MQQVKIKKIWRLAIFLLMLGLGSGAVMSLAATDNTVPIILSPQTNLDFKDKVVTVSASVPKNYYNYVNVELTLNPVATPFYTAKMTCADDVNKVGWLICNHSFNYGASSNANFYPYDNNQYLTVRGVGTNFYKKSQAVTLKKTRPKPAPVITAPTNNQKIVNTAVKVTMEEGSGLEYYEYLELRNADGVLLKEEPISLKKNNGKYIGSLDVVMSKVVNNKLTEFPSGFYNLKVIGYEKSTDRFQKKTGYASTIINFNYISEKVGVAITYPQNNANVPQGKVKILAELGNENNTSRTARANYFYLNSSLTVNPLKFGRDVAMNLKTDGRAAELEVDFSKIKDGTKIVLEPKVKVGNSVFYGNKVSFTIKKEVKNPINGACGSAHGQTVAVKPYYNLCQDNSLPTVNGNGPWTWVCAGKDGGKNASCFANKKIEVVKIDGQCGSSHGQEFVTKPTSGLCQDNSLPTVNGNGPWTWVCLGANGGKNANCQAMKKVVVVPVDGVCGSAHGQEFVTKPTSNLCQDNSLPTVNGNGPWTWVCAGKDGGVNANCQATKKIETETPIVNNPEACESLTQITFDGKVYPLVIIGDQCWFAKNLNRGQVSSSQSNNRIVEKRCYNDQTSNCDTEYAAGWHGGLYGFDEATNYFFNDLSLTTPGICPTGFHVPTKADYEKLVTVLGGETKAKEKLIQGGSTGFNALYSGRCDSGSCIGLCNPNLAADSTCYFYAWYNDDFRGKYFIIDSEKAYTSTYSSTFNTQTSVRCIKNDVTTISEIPLSLTTLNGTEFNIDTDNKMVQLKVDSEAALKVLNLRIDGDRVLASNLPGKLTYTGASTMAKPWTFTWDLTGVSEGIYAIRAVGSIKANGPVAQSSILNIKVTKNPVFENNEKNLSKFNDKEVFIAKSTSWQSVLPLVSMTTWNETTGEVVKHPVLIYQNDNGKIDIDSTMTFLSQYNPTKVTLVDHSGEEAERIANYLIAAKPAGAGMANTGDNIFTINGSDYLTYWSFYKDVVYTENNYEKASVAAVYASLINAPLIIKNTSSDIDANFVGKNVICVGNVSRACNATYNLAQLRTEYVAKARLITGQSVNKIVFTNVNDLNYALATSRPQNPWEGFKTKISGDYLTNFFGKHSLVAPFMAAAKNQYLLTASDNIGSAGNDPQDPYFGKTTIKKTNKGSNCNDPQNYFRCSYWQGKIKEVVANLGLTLEKGNNSGDQKINGFLTIVADPQAVPYHYWDENKSTAIAYSSDSDYFANMTGSSVAELAYGRIVGFTVSDASTMANRSLYMSAMPIKNGVAMFSTAANGETKGNNFVNGACSKFTSAGYSQQSCATYNLDAYSDRYTNSNYDQINREDASKWKESYLNYYHDHGSSDYAGIYTSYIPELNNSFIATMACATAQADINIDQQWNFALMALRQGAAAYLGAVDATYENAVDKATINDIFYTKTKTIGEAFRDTYNNYSTTLLADPTVNLISEQTGAKGINSKIWPVN